MTLRIDQPWWRDIGVARLRELLAEAPDDARICVNPVGNLSILSSEGTGFEYLGYVDISDESIVLFDADPPPEE